MIINSTPKYEAEPAISSSLTGIGTEFSFPSQHPKHRYGCTCREPPGVTFFDGSNVDLASKTIFIENLRAHGWSPIVISEAPSPPPSQEEILAIFRRRRQRQRKVYTERYKGDVAFIAAESGSSEATIEPKESLEVQLSKCLRNNNFEEDKKDDDEARIGDNGDETTVKTWCQTMSWIAHEISGLMLDVPENVFLPDDPNESLDLLRVFHYYAVETEMSKEPSQNFSTLGSSEHTDWGSLTVVWQDSVGGLQTYCRSCNKWIDVKPAAAEETKAIETTKGTNHRWECIVHVGDMASLLLDKSSDVEKIPNHISDGHHIPHPWPSPKHRVKSHPHKERASLVYFGYPPRGLSLRQIQKRLDRSWPHFSTRGKRLPLQDYYLLHDQSAAEQAGGGAGSDDNDAEAEANRLYRTIWNLPVQDTIRLKWEQVNREG